MGNQWQDDTKGELRYGTYSTKAAVVGGNGGDGQEGRDS